MELEKIGISAGAGALYAAGAFASTALFAATYSLVNSYCPSIMGPLNAGLVISASSMGAFSVSMFLDKRNHDTLSAITGMLIVFLATATLTPTVSNLLSTYKVSYLGSSLYGLAGAGTFLYIKPKAEPIRFVEEFYG